VLVSAALPVAGRDSRSAKSKSITLRHPAAGARPNVIYNTSSSWPRLSAQQVLILKGAVHGTGNTHWVDLVHGMSAW